MIATMNDAFRPELPIEILYAQARISKLIIERGLPGRLIRLCAYLVSTTSLKRAGRVHLSRSKVAQLIGVSERTVDRYFDQLEEHHILERLERNRAAGQFFFGTCVRWSYDIWEALFLTPPRSRSVAIAEKFKPVFTPVEPTIDQATHPYVEEIPALVAGATESNVTCLCEDASLSGEGMSLMGGKPTPIEPASQATKMTHYSSSISTIVSNRSFLLNNPQALPTFESQPARKKPTVRALQSLLQSAGKVFHAPSVIVQWAKQLGLTDQNVGMLMAVAKKTDINRTKTRLQDLLRHVGPRLLERAIAGANASKYLYKCLVNNEDYSDARFAAQDVSVNEDQREIDDANALRRTLAAGKITELLGSHYLRDDLVVYRVDPTVGLAGRGHVTLTREQMAVLARRAELV